MFGSNNNWHNVGTPKFGMLNKTYSIATYAMDARNKQELNVRDSIFDDLHKLPNPLQKNLGDTITRESTVEKINMAPLLTQETKVYATRTESTFSGIGNFLSNMVSVVSEAVFHKRAKSPAPSYYDCVDDLNEARDLLNWHPSKSDVQNKNKAPNDQMVDMNTECRAAAAHCEDKLLKVRQLLTAEAVKVPVKSRLRRPRRVFVDAASIEEDFVDAFEPEDFYPLPSEDFLEYVSQFAYQNVELFETDSPKIKTDLCFKKPEEKSAESVSDKRLDVPNIGETNTQIEPDNAEQPIQIKEETNITITEEPTDKLSKDIPKVTEVNVEIVSSCEDKLSKLKNLLMKSKAKYKTRSELDCDKNCKTEKIHNKHFKNPCRLSGPKKGKQRMRKDILEDIATKIDYESGTEESMNQLSDSKFTDNSFTTNSSVDSSGSLKFGDYFNEVTGRFRNSSTTESEDSFQIVFNESPRQRRVSDCESEDSFIVFEDSPDSCYITNDVISEDSETENEDSDSSDSESDSGHMETGGSLAPFLSRTISDLTDDSLYEEKSHDEVDCAVRMCEEIPSHELVELQPCGLLIDGTKKKLKSKESPKKVTFSSAPPVVHTLRVWAFAARQARPGPWEQIARDRERFQRRIANVEMSISWVLKPQHRSRVVFQRFRPWWNAQRRLEIVAEAEQNKKIAKLNQESEDTAGKEDNNDKKTEEKNTDDVDSDASVTQDEKDDEKGVKIVECKNDIEKLDDDIKLNSKNDNSKKIIETLEIETEIVVTEIETQILADKLAQKRLIDETFLNSI